MAKAKKTRWWDTSIAHHQIIKVGEKATLIMMPKPGPFAGYKFWYPNKLIRYGPYADFLKCCDEMSIRLVRKAGEETTITGDKFRYTTYEEPV